MPSTYKGVTTGKSNDSKNTCHCYVYKNIYGGENISCIAAVRSIEDFVESDVCKQCVILVILLRGAIVNRTYDKHKNLYISLFLLSRFGPFYYGPPKYILQSSDSSIVRATSGFCVGPSVNQRTATVSINMNV